MRLLDRLFPARLQRRLMPLANELGRRCQPAVERAISEDLASMSFAEARGYLRARARPAVQAAVADAADAAISPALTAMLMEMAIEQVIVRMIAEHVKSATPPRVALRRAA